MQKWRVLPLVELAIIIATAVLTFGIGLGSGSAAKAENWPVMRDDILLSSKMNLDLSDATVLEEIFANATVLGSEIFRREIGSIQFENRLGGAPKEAWDVSQKQDGKVLAWVTNRNDGLYDLHIAGDGGVRLPEICGYLFAYYMNVTSIDFGDCVSTAEVTNMSSMFLTCPNLRSLDLSGFDTRNVTNMRGMFVNCIGLTKLDVSGFDTGNVTNMRGMFSNCANAKALNVAHFDTKNVTDLAYMFMNCMSLESLDVSGFDTTNVADMSGMFMNCTALNHIKASEKFVLPQDPDGMFDNCPAGGLTIE